LKHVLSFDIDDKANSFETVICSNVGDQHPLEFEKTKKPLARYGEQKG